jgi:hypothetical protein
VLFICGRNITDWLNDLDLRGIVAGALAVAPGSERDAVRRPLDRADDAFRAATLEFHQSLWGSGEGMRLSTIPFASGGTFGIRHIPAKLCVKIFERPGSP